MNYIIGLTDRMDIATRTITLKSFWLMWNKEQNEWIIHSSQKINLKIKEKNKGKIIQLLSQWKSPEKNRNWVSMEKGHIQFKVDGFEIIDSKLVEKGEKDEFPSPY